MITTYLSSRILQSQTGPQFLPGGHSELEPPDPIPNSEVKQFSADDSVGFPYVKVGHCQAFTPNPIVFIYDGVFYGVPGMVCGALTSAVPVAAVVDDLEAGVLYALR